jgi:outer membrane cobalamin receptor
MPLDLTLRAENLLDEAYEEVLGYRAAGRTVSVGVRMRCGGEG